MSEYWGTQMQGPQDPREGLEAVVALRRMLEALEAAQVENAVVAGWSWVRIAEVLGVSKQAVHKKHAKRLRDKYSGKRSGGRDKRRVIFNRIVTEARRCVETALEEARLLGHDSVGDEDLLLGVLRAGEGTAPEALASLGVTLEAVREESEGLFADALSSIGISLEEIKRGAGKSFEMRIPGNRRLPFSPRAKKALEQALREGRSLGDNRLTSEHILLGILRDQDGTAVRILFNLGVRPEEAEDRLNQLRGRTPRR